MKQYKTPNEHKQAELAEEHIMHQILGFINNQLNDDQLDQFMMHIEQCPECYEEVQISYFLYNGLRMLDEEQPASFHLQKEFERMIAEKKQYISKRRRLKNFIAFMLGLVCAGVVLFGGFTVFKYLLQVL